jgi:Flp pilus assembly protein TadG
MAHLLPLTLRRRRPGQALPLTALILPVLLAFTLMVVEVAERWLEVSMVEDALQHATRSAVQSLDYAAFARGETDIRAGETCLRQTVAASVGGPCEDVIALADRFLRINLRGVRGMVGSTPEAAIEAVAARVEWTVMPAGGGCTFGSGKSVPDEPTPLICAEVHPTMEGLVGWGHYTPAIVAADRLDPITP